MLIRFFKQLPEISGIDLRAPFFSEAIQKIHRSEGQRTGCALFSDRGRMPSRKMLVAVTPRALLPLGEGVFFGSVSFAPFKRNELARSAKRFFNSEAGQAFAFRQAQSDPRKSLPDPPLPSQGREQTA